MLLAQQSIQIMLLIESQETLHHLGTTADDSETVEFSEAGQKIVSGE